MAGVAAVQLNLEESPSWGLGALNASTSLIKLVKELMEVNKPIAILGAEVDNLSPPELIRQFEEILSTKPKLEYLVKIFPGVSHGWTVRYNEGDKKVVKSAEEAHQDLLAWFVKHVK